MPRYQVKPREDGRGPYRWSHVVKNPLLKNMEGGTLRQGSIYRHTGFQPLWPVRASLAILNAEYFTLGPLHLYLY